MTPLDSPCLHIDIGKIERNARAVVELCAGAGIAVTGVTKGVCGHPEVAAAMLRGGVASLADSRLLNINRLRRAGIDAPLMLLRLPPLSRVAEVVESVSVSLNSEQVVLRRLAEAAVRSGRAHDVIVMVDMGDLREGLRPDEVVPFVREAVTLPGIRIRGLGVNLACFAGVVPSETNMSRFVAIAEEVEAACGIALEWLSGVNSSGLELIAAGRMPARVNHARIGEAILLGRETTHRRPWPGTVQDAFVLRAEVLECRHKPSQPDGACAEDAFGRLQVFPDRGGRLRALVNLGREDVDPDSLTPTDANVVVLGASSGYLAVDVTDAAAAVEVGGELTFVPGYAALLRAMTSEYVAKQCV